MQFKLTIKVSLLVVLVSLFYQSTNAQTGSVWYFGFNAGIDFRDDEPKPLFHGAFNCFEGGTSVCDSSGNILFYSNGETVWGRDHNPFPNSNQEKNWGNYYGYRTICVKKPGSRNTYCLFAFKIETLNRADSVDLYYSEIDMSLRGGLGDVSIKKDILIASAVLERVAIVGHRNEEDYWVVGHYMGDNRFFSYLLSQKGVSVEPVISVAGETIPRRYNEHSREGFKVSPDGTMLAMANYHEEFGVSLYHFDNAAGKIFPIGNIAGFNKNRVPFGVEFSPNSKVLYVSTPKNYQIHQCNLASLNIKSISESRQVIGTELANDNAFGLQLGPDGRIYFAQYNTHYLGVILYPNTLGKSCEFQPQGFSLGDRYSGWSLPIFPNVVFNFDYKDCNLFIPSAFSPNEDGLNDEFKPVSGCKTVTFSMDIFSMWGERIFGNSLNQGWPGLIGENKVPTGTYLYVITYHYGDLRWQTQSGYVLVIN